ncbi:DUF2939 domain-containing protein [Onishia taeanensis]
MKKGLIGLTLALAAGYAIGSPYLTSYQIKTAANERDGEALAEHVDFPVLRQNLKDQFNLILAQEMEKQVSEDNPFGALGAAFGSMMTDKMVDAYVTPAALAAKLNGRSEPAQQPEGGNESKPDTSTDTDAGENPFRDVQMSYQEWDVFHVVVRNEDAEPLTFVLRRQGIGWKLTNIQLPEKMFSS